MNVSLKTPVPLETGDPAALMREVAAGLIAGSVIPYIGAAVSGLAGASVPLSPESLADYFATKVALPKRARGNAWASAQHIESMKHRSTVTTLMKGAFADPVAPGALHRYFASLALPLIVDSWYDGAMRAALAAAGGSWGEVQGITRAGIGEDRWYRFYDQSGAESDRAAASGWKTLLYKPHGGITPAANFLISDADYVEVLTEIDIQTPIPDEVKNRRAGRSLFFIGCRFNDQMLRSYAKQIMKRSSARHYAVVDPALLSRNEAKFLAIEGITPIALSLPEAAAMLAG